MRYNPVLEPFSRGRLRVEFDESRCIWRMIYDDKQLMCFNTRTYRQHRELENHIKFGRGDVVCTGLGFGVREAGLLNKPDVTRLTVLEKNRDVIAYHRAHSPWFNDERLHVLPLDCRTATGECDVLLLDHFPDQRDYFEDDFWLKEAAHIQKNIKSDLTWVWPIETVLSVVGADRYSEFRRKYAINLPSFTRSELNATIAAAAGADYVCTN